MLSSVPRRRRSSPGGFAVLSLLLVVATACAPKRPVLYPNAQLRAVGDQEAEFDIEDCIQLAKDADLGSNKGGEVAKAGAKGAAVGGATGAAVGAVTGPLSLGAAAGAAGGAAAAMTRRIFGVRELDPVERGYVNRCLRERGYDVMGWK